MLRRKSLTTGNKRYCPSSKLPLLSKPIHSKRKRRGESKNSASWEWGRRFLAFCITVPYCSWTLFTIGSSRRWEQKVDFFSSLISTASNASNILRRFKAFTIFKGCLGGRGRFPESPRNGSPKTTSTWGAQVESKG